MEFIYIIIENGEPYLKTFKNYKSAIQAIKEKHKEYLEEQIKEVYDLYSIETILDNINVPENIESGISYLYIEKGIHIHIHKVVIKN
jgi:hypothetical protein